MRFARPPALSTVLAARPPDRSPPKARVGHGGQIKAGSLVIDVFAEPDRYPLKAR